MHSDQYTIYCDLDGVLADFSKGVEILLANAPHAAGSTTRSNRMWKAIEAHQKLGYNFWGDLPLMADARELWDFILPYDPIILSAVGQKRFFAGPQKLNWIIAHFGSVTSIMTEHSRNKAVFANSKTILIDDRDKSIGPWVEAGGIGILHTSAKQTITKLQQLGLK